MKQKDQENKESTQLIEREKQIEQASEWLLGESADSKKAEGPSKRAEKAVKILRSMQR
jgi:hypothetical protein